MKSYTAEDIEVLEGLEPVRKRPGMYIAGTDTTQGLHQLVTEILDNSVDEASNGYADTIEVTLHSNKKSVTVSDNGRGIPVETHPKFKKSALELILTTLHAGGKFSDKNYLTAGGLHGVGSSVVNALSEHLEARVFRGGKVYTQEFSKGIPLKAMSSKPCEKNRRGTSIKFSPDWSIFTKVSFSGKFIRDALKTKAYLNPNIKFIFNDEAENKSEEFLFRNGIKDYLATIIEDKKITPIGSEVFFISKDNELDVELSFCWTESTREESYSYANGIETLSGGSHEVGAKSGIVKGVRNYITVHNSLPKGLKLSAEDIREGLLLIVSVKLPANKFQIQFQGQTKDKLNNPEVQPIVENIAKTIEQVLNEKPSVAQLIVNRIILSAKARAASRQASENVRRKIGVNQRLTLPGKLADCSSRKQKNTELFIVEGDSAGGSAKQGRDRNFQAVLPLRGKVLNSITSTNKKALENRELSDIISALACGIGDSSDPNKTRYGKIIILTDADADGMHIATLLLAFFFKHLKPIIQAGQLYLGKPPLYGVYPQKTTKSFWAYDEVELVNIIKEKKLNNPRIIRFKGLGEMNPETLWQTTLDPEKRTLLRVTFSDEERSAQALESLMGSDSSERFRLISENAERFDSEIDV